MSQSQVQQLIDAVKAASPALWAAARHQVQAQIAVDWFWVWTLSIVIGILLAVIAAGTVILCFATDSYNDNRDFIGGMMMVLGAVGILIFGFALAWDITDLIQKLNAPDYAAIQNLTNLIPTHS